MRGLFISFEGNDGSGKSSAMKYVNEELLKRGYHTLVTREPGGTPISENIRNVILDVNNKGMDPITEAYLYAASRRENVVKKIIPALEEGTIVLTDRYIDSSLAYQGVARAIGVDKVMDLNKYAIDGLFPDLTILIATRPEVGMTRIKRDQRDLDRLEIETIDFHNTVYNGFESLVEKFPERILRINGETGKEKVAEDALEAVLKVLKANE